MHSLPARFRSLLLVLSIPFLCPALRAAETPKLLTPEAALKVHRLQDLQLTHDGSRLAFVVTEPPTGQHPSTHLWVLDTKSGLLRQFTYSQKSESSPRWSPDGKELAFLSNRGGEEKQIYLMRSSGGEAHAITEGKRSVEHVAWSPDGKQIAFLAPDAKSEEQEKKEKDKDDARVVDKDDKRARLWVLALASKELKALTPPNWEIAELAWLPSGKEIVVRATDHPESDQNTDRIFSVDTFSGAMKQLSAPRGPFNRLRISPSGKTIAYVGCRQDGPDAHDLMLLPAEGSVARNLTGASLDRQIIDFQWLANSGIAASIADGFRSRLVFFSPDGVLDDFSPKIESNPSDFVSGPSGDIYFVSQTATHPQELWHWNRSSSPVQVSHINDAWNHYGLVAPEFYKYKSFDGLEIEAALLKPANYDGKSKLPLIALIHGGPTGNWEDAVDELGQLLVARGYAVFYPNIRGSVGYGQKFIEMNRGDWGGADYKDVHDGIDDLIAKGIADPDKLAIGGWSYGGYMSEWAITQDARFKAAVSGAGMANLISEFGTEQHPSYDEWFYGVPYERPEGFLNSSPFLYLKNAKTPTLILQGDADTVDPLGQSQELYRGLKRYGVETELVVYPREPHGFHEEKHLLDRLNRILAWYDKHLK